MARAAAIIGFLLMVAYWPGIAGMARTPRWIVGGLIVAAFIFAPRIQWTRTHFVGLLLVLWLFASVILHPTWDSGDALLRLVIISVAFGFGSTLTDLKPFILGAALGLAVSSVIIVLEYMDVLALPNNAAGPAALFYNKNYLAEAAALVIVAAALHRLPFWFLLPAVTLPLSKTAFVALIPMAFAGPLDSTYERIGIWRDTIGALTWTGHGLGSFWTTFPNYAQHYLEVRKHVEMPEHPHNEFLLVAYEGGYLALLAVLAFGYFLWRDCQKEFRPVLISIGVVACFSVLSDNPASILFGAVCAGFAVGDRRRQLDISSASGDSLFPSVALADRSRAP